MTGERWAGRLRVELIRQSTGLEYSADGVCPNAAMDLDEGMQTTCLTDPIGGSSSFCDTRIRLVKA